MTPAVPSEQLSRTATSRTGTTQADAAVASARRQLGRSSASLWAGTTTRTWSIGTVTILSSPWYGRVFFRPGSQQITTFRTSAAARPPAVTQVENCFGETSLDAFGNCGFGVQDGVLRLCFKVQNGILHRRIFRARSEEHTSELQSLMRISYAVFCLKRQTSIIKEKSSHTNRTDSIVSRL